jgi:hypothetical protein
MCPSNYAFDLDLWLVSVPWTTVEPLSPPETPPDPGKSGLEPSLRSSASSFPLYLPSGLLDQEGVRRVGAQRPDVEKPDLPVATGELDQLKTSFVINANMAMTRYYS